eukprot:TRINITY_DN430_c0_g1_i1.p1 TRINITY_DN430_c0_g1~~TRINITY_DN430_c0_g1_i1.p1  ORF type:complete len:111 (+),score=20.86 TRINITY_DN430_c0_g1_i1:197-529(+)
MSQTKAVGKDIEVYTSFDSFYPFYLKEHSNRTNRRLHLIGTFIGQFFAIYFLLTGQFIKIPLAFIPGYFFAWIGHFVFQKNKPATFKYPFFSLMGDFKMFYQVLTGKIAF